ncbi:hypothetical protein FI667_g7947, partial [Globisporangium splendens]
MEQTGGDGDASVDGREPQDATTAIVLQDLARDSNGSGSGASSSTAQVNGEDDSEYRDRIAMCEFVVRCATRLLLDQVRQYGALCVDADGAGALSDLLHAQKEGDNYRIAQWKKVPYSRLMTLDIVSNDTNEPMGTGSRYTNLKMSLINAEQTVLRVLGFDVDVALPFNYLFKYAEQLKFAAPTTHCAVKLASDVYFDARVLALPPFVIAAASLHIASKLVESQDAREDKWWYLYDTSDGDIALVAGILLRVYRFMDSNKRNARTARTHPTGEEDNAPDA